MRRSLQGEVEIVFRPDPTIHDGSFANNGWLQELPKPLFKTTWENVDRDQPGARAAARLTSGDMSASKRRPVDPRPGLGPSGAAERVVTLFLGYGRTRAGRIGTGIGYDAYGLRTAASPWTAPAR